MGKDELKEYLDALDRSDRYHVEQVLKDSLIERTERVNYIADDGSESGPFIRKTISADSGQGRAYERIFEAQKKGKRFVHLPRIFECFRTGESLVVVLEFIQGRTLQEYVADEGASRMLAREVFPRICDAVIELHEALDAPIIHRDLTPTNILVSHTDVALIDLGISRTFDPEADHDTTYFGTRAYAPPEQFGFGQTDVRSDVYALGKVLRFCSNGSEGMSASSKDAHMRDQGAQQSKVVSGGWIDPAVEAVIEVATSFDPAGRYQSVAELKDAFIEAGSVEPLRPLGSSEPLEPVLSKETSADVPVSALMLEPPKAEERVELRAEQPIGRSRSDMSRGLAKIPKPLGIVWDTVVILAWLLVLVLSIELVFEPGEALGALPPWFRAVEIFGIVFLPFTVVVYFLLDLRLIRESFPKLRLPVRRKTWFLIPVVIIGSWALVVIIASISGYATFK